MIRLALMLLKNNKLNSNLGGRMLSGGKFGGIKNTAYVPICPYLTFPNLLIIL